MGDKAPENMFRLATTADAKAVLALYHAQLGRPGCPWTTEYPNAQTIADDTARHTLHLLCDDATGTLLAAATLRPWPEHDTAAPWRHARTADLMRICVAPARQRQGLARAMMEHLRQCLRNDGLEAMRILVADTNVPARALYASLGAQCRGDHFAYDLHWLCFEWEI